MHLQYNSHPLLLISFIGCFKYKQFLGLKARCRCIFGLINYPFNNSLIYLKFCSLKPNQYLSESTHPNLILQIHLHMEVYYFPMHMENYLKSIYCSKNLVSMALVSIKYDKYTVHISHPTPWEVQDDIFCQFHPRTFPWANSNISRLDKICKRYICCILY